MKKLYSHDGENYICNQLSDALDYFDGCVLGEIVTAYEGELHIHKASFFLPDDLGDDMSERAWDNHGEFSDDWPNLSQDKESELLAVIDKWFTDNKNQPSFGIIENVKKLKYKVTDLEDVDKWELIDEK